MKFRQTGLFIYFSFLSVFLYAQNPTIDSLNASLERQTEIDSSFISTLVELSYAYTQVNPDSTLQIGQKAYELAKENDFRLLEAWALNRMSGYYWMTAKFPDALRIAQQSLKIFEELQNDKGIADCLNVLANTHVMDDDPEKALEYYQKSVEIFEKLNDIDAISRAFSNMGRTNYIMGQYEEALVYMGKVRELQEGKNNIMESIMYNTTGDIYQELNKHDLALSYYFRGLEIAEYLGIARIITYSTRGIAEVYQILENIPESNKYAQRTLEISREIGYLENVRNAALILSDNYRALNDFENAYNYFLQYSSTKDTMFNMDKKRELQKIEENFEIAQKQQEIELLTTEKELQTQQSRQQWMLMYGLIIIITLVVITAVIQYRRNVLKQKTNRILTDQKNRLSRQNIDIKKQREEIEKQSILLSEANKEKDKLFSIISHDLKSPFGALLMVTEHLDQQTFSQEELTNLKVDLHSKVKSLNEMLNNLLEWSRSQMKGTTTQKEHVDISKMIHNNVSVFNQIAKEKGIHLSTDIEEGVKVYADENQIDCVLRNLINNAIKFTEKGGEIKIELEQSDDKVQVNISDTGVGIDPKIQEKLFTVSNDVHTKGTANETGSGIGLFLSKEFIENNYGTIDVESEPGVGSTFYFELPTDRVAEEAN